MTSGWVDNVGDKNQEGEEARQRDLVQNIELLNEKKRKSGILRVCSLKKLLKEHKGNKKKFMKII